MLFLQVFLGFTACVLAVEQPYTSASVSLSAVDGFPYSQISSSSANGFASGDAASGFSLWNSSAHASASFGYNSVFADSAYAYVSPTNGYGGGIEGPAPSPGQQSASSLYSLGWNSADHSQSGVLISQTFNIGNAGCTASGLLYFVYGASYTFNSLLSVNTANQNSTAAADSVWSDTITFYGQPNGTHGSATFTVTLNGSVIIVQDQFTRSQLGQPLQFDESSLVGDFSGGARLAEIDLPLGTTIQSQSGFVYPVPEPGVGTVFGLGLLALYLSRAQLKLRALRQKEDSTPTR